MQFDNLVLYDTEKVYEGCIILTIPGERGFIWIEPSGFVHISDVNIRIHMGNVHELIDSKTGSVSHGWEKR